MAPSLAAVARWIPALGILALIACSEDPASPLPAEEQFRVVGRPESSDTIGAMLRDSLVLEILNTNGKPESGALINVTGRVGAKPSMFVWNEALNGWSESRTYTTDGRGRVAIAVRMGDYPGAAALTVTAARDSVVVGDTIDFNVTPGNLHAVVAPVIDTTLILTRGFALGARAVDRRGNLRSDPILYTIGDSRLSVNASGNVTTMSYGRSHVVSSVGSLADTTWVTVVPAGRIASVWGNWLDLHDTDGSNPRRVVVSNSNRVENPVWHPNGDIIVTSSATGQVPRLVKVDATTGAARRFIPDTSAIVSENLASVSSDGAYVYFFANSVYGMVRYQMWRVRIDGTGLERVSEATLEYFSGTPAPSPDLSRVIYNAGAFQSGGLYELNMNTGETTLFERAAVDPKWSPTEDRLAFFKADGLWIVNGDGTSPRRLLAEEWSSAMWYQWSPDGRWIVFHHRTISVINVESGERIFLPFGTDVPSNGVAWH